MVHDLVGGDPHIKRVAGGLGYCMCFGPCCTMADMNCICEECDCGAKGSSVISVKDTVAEVMTARTPDGHFCVTCGTEVFRNGTRGRFPSKCPTCKAA